MSIQYSDGVDLEAKILNLLDKQTDLSSKYSICKDHYDQWAIRYHLCTERSNLLRHLNFQNLDVLELGAGMGAVSRFLAENCRHLTVVEGTQQRFAALSSRLRDLKNWSGQVANLQDVQIEKKFDVVCVIGVLEYSELFIEVPTGSKETPFSLFLKKATSFLKEDGVLVLAIENKLGIKYWSGAAEDHTGRIFDGVCDYPLGKTPKTFSRIELRKLLENQRLSSTLEYYPFPDYKVPVTVISDTLVDTHSELASDLATIKNYENYNNPRVNLFPESLALRSLAKGELFKDFSNSFLFVSTHNSDSPTLKQLLEKQTKNHELGWHYTNTRAIPTQTIFRSVKSNIASLEVVKQSLFTNEETNKIEETLFSGTQIQVKWSPIAVSPFVSGESLETVLIQCIYFEDWNRFFSEFRSFLKWSIQNWSLKDSHTQKIDGKAIDAVFSNAKKTWGASSQYSIFDLEWTLTSPMSISWFIFRNILLFAKLIHLFPKSRPFENLKNLYQLICQELQVQPYFENDVNSEAEFQFLATSIGSIENYKQSIYSLFTSPLADPNFPRLPREEYSMRSELQSTRAKCLHLETRIQELEMRASGLSHLLNSRPHRLAEKVNQTLLKLPILHKLAKLSVRWIGQGLNLLRR